MKYQQLCDEIIAKIGGKENVKDVSHCITRLRFHLKDESKAQTEELKATKGVVDVIQAGGQYQVVIGSTVEAVYNDLVQIGGFDAQPALDIDEGDDVKKGDPFSRLLAVISEILQPVLGVLMAGGFIKSMLALASVAGWLAKDSNTYVVLSAIGDSVFYYFPLIIGWTSAKKFGLKPVMGMGSAASSCTPRSWRSPVPIRSTPSVPAPSLSPTSTAISLVSPWLCRATLPRSCPPSLWCGWLLRCTSSLSTSCLPS